MGTPPFLTFVLIALGLVLYTTLSYVPHYSSALHPFVHSARPDPYANAWFHASGHQIAISAPVQPQRRKILMISDYREYLERMDRYAMDLADAAVSHPDLDATVWGPNWGGWSSNMTFAENIETRYGCGYFDVVFWMWPAKTDVIEGPLGCGTVLVTKIGDCHDNEDCINDWFPFAANVTLTGYSFELIDHFNYHRLAERYPQNFSMHLFGHSPDCANLEDFYPREKDAQPQTDVVLLGHDWAFYEIRHKVAWAQEHNETWISRVPHPGYVTSVDPIYYSEPLSDYDPLSPATASHRRTVEHFASTMRNSKICLFDSSMEKKMIRKYTQAMLSGCVIASDLPSEHEEILRDIIIYLDPEWDMDQIHAKLKDALADPAELARKAQAGFDYAIKYLQCKTSIDGVMHFADMYRRGVRGYSWPFGFSAICRRNNPGSFGPYLQPPWCEPWGPRPDSL